MAERTGQEKIDKLLILLSYLSKVRFCSPRGAPTKFTASEVDRMPLSSISACSPPSRFYFIIRINPPHKERYVVV